MACRINVLTLVMLEVNALTRCVDLTHMKPINLGSDYDGVLVVKVNDSVFTSALAITGNCNEHLAIQTRIVEVSRLVQRSCSGAAQRNACGMTCSACRCPDTAAATDCACNRPWWPKVTCAFWNGTRTRQKTPTTTVQP